MDELNKLFQRVTVTVQRAQAAGKRVTPAAIDGLVMKWSDGKILSMDQLQNQLKMQDMTPGLVEGTARSLTRGATLGFNDEIAGLTDKLLGGNYTDARDAERASEVGFRHAHPKTALAAELAPALATTLASGGAAGPTELPGLMELLTKGALVGGGVGAIQGVGDAPEAKDIPESALEGGAVGALAGGALGAATKPIATVAGSAAQLLKRAVQPAKAATTEALAGLARGLPADTRAILARGEAAQPGLTHLFDAAPDMMDVAASKNTGIRRAAEGATAGRNAGAGDRLAESALSNAGMPGLDGNAARKALEQGIPEARKAYTALESLYPEGSINLAGTPIAEALGDGDIGGAYQSFKVPGKDPGFRNLQSTLLRLKGKATAAYRDPTLMLEGKSGPQWEDVANKFEDAMEQTVPGFRAANRGYHIAKSALGDFDEGTKALLRDPRELADHIQALEADDPTRAKAFKMGALDQFTQQLRDLAPGSDAYRQAMRRGNKGLESRLAALFPDQASLDRFLADSDVEEMFRKSYTALGGSKTQPRAGLEKQMFGKTSMSGDQPLSVQLWKAGHEALVGGHDEAVAGEYGKRLLAGGPRLQAVLDEIEGVRQKLTANTRTLQSFGTELTPAVAGEQQSKVRDLWR